MTNDPLSPKLDATLYRLCYLHGYNCAMRFWDDWREEQHGGAHNDYTVPQDPAVVEKLWRDYEAKLFTEEGPDKEEANEHE